MACTSFQSSLHLLKRNMRQDGNKALLNSSEMKERERETQKLKGDWRYDFMFRSNNNAALAFVLNFLRISSKPTRFLTANLPFMFIEGFPSNTLSHFLIMQFYSSSVAIRDLPLFLLCTVAKEKYSLHDPSV